MQRLTSCAQPWPVFKFKTEEEVVAAANDAQVGLASYFYSRDIGRIYRVGEALEYGMVGISIGYFSPEQCALWRRQTVRPEARRARTAWMICGDQVPLYRGYSKIKTAPSPADG